MLKYLSKFAMEIIPSVVATILGAYIVNHYITNKSTEAPPAAVARVDAGKSEPKGDSKSDEASADPAPVPAPGVKARGIAERTVLGRPAADAVPVTTDRPVEKPAEAAAAQSAEPRRIPLSKPAPKVATAPASGPASAPATVPAAPVSEPTGSADRDATELARAAIERLRSTETHRRPQPETPRTSDPAPVQEASRAPAPTGPMVRPLPPPIMVAAPASNLPAGATAAPVTTGTIRASDDPLRPTPPAEIPQAVPPPPSKPLDLRADANTMAEDVLSAAKSMFHSVLPK